MTVDIINGNGEGWANYVLGKNTEREHSKLILGDTKLGDEICQSVDYKSGNSVKMVISFSDEDKINPKRGRKIVKDFLKEYMHGFRSEEYHVDCAEHTDTNYLHYHVRIPKLNLLTGTQLKAYYHKSDLSYKIAVIDRIAQKYDLIVGMDNKKLVVEPSKKVEQINKWRADHGQKPFDLSSKSGRGEAEESLLDYFTQMNMQGLIGSLHDVTAELRSMGFEIKKIDHDRGKDFDYITVQNDTGKIRLKGDIYGEKFYEHSREDRSKAISVNRSLDKGSQSDKRSRSDIEQALRQERSKRLTWIDRQYGSARKRAIQRLQKEQRQFTKEHHRNEKNVPENFSPNCTTDRRKHRNLGNSLLLSRLHQLGEASRQDSERKERKKIFEIGRNTFEKDQEKGIENDTITAEIVRRIRSIREGANQRTRRLRESLGKNSRKLNGSIPNIDERFIQNHIIRSNKIDRTIGNLNHATADDFKELEKAIISHKNERAVGQDFDAIIYRIRAGISGLLGDLKQEFNRRTQNLILGVSNAIKINRLYEVGKKKVLSERRHKKIIQAPRR